ncbi:hypothetical protein [Solidesulfovibrio sp.]|uniref:hypothetical protein n=1 Tax=Solidesulfovibrio sp. TaxID=2910990 RepID=UPI00260F2856|nr:hypothetical protein [Solidesulfovibrio sp.]
MLLLSRFNIFNISQVKDVAIWVVFFGVFNFIKHANSDNIDFKNLVFSSVRIEAVIQFLTSRYVLPLPLEIASVPIILFLSFMYSVSVKDGYKKVEYFGGLALFFIGIMFIIYSMACIVMNFRNEINGLLLNDFIVTPLLTVFYIPFLFAFSVYCKYEAAFARMRVFIRDRSILSRAKFLVFKDFLLDIGMLNRWLSDIHCQDTSDIEGITKSIKRIRRLARQSMQSKKNQTGWNPASVGDFLATKGLKTGFYKEICAGDWGASSSMLPVNDELLADNISYYAEGVENEVRKLKIIFNAHNKSMIESGYPLFKECVFVLVNVALDSAAMPGLVDALNRKVEYEEKVSMCVVKLEISTWISGIVGGVTYKLTLDADSVRAES